MRPIEFRGLRTDGKGWVYGYYFFNGNEHGIVDNNGFPGSWHEVRPETVGQFTGLHDKTAWNDASETDRAYAYAAASKNGTAPEIEWKGCKIFEGDINNGRTAILFNQKLSLFAEHYWSEFNKDWYVSSYPINTDYITIIGSVHESPELLNQTT